MRRHPQGSPRPRGAGGDPHDTGPPPPPPEITDDDVPGCVGTVTVRIAGGDVPGEVRVYVRGTWELFIAYALEPTERGARVRVESSRGHRTVDVTWIAHGDPPGGR